MSLPFDGRMRPAVGLMSAGDQVEQGGLAGAVGADHADHLAGGDGEFDILEDAGAADLQAEALDRQRGRVVVRILVVLA